MAAYEYNGVRTNKGVILMTTYLDCNATTPISGSVRNVVTHFLFTEFGNAGSRTHEYGVNAKKAVEIARKHLATIVDAEPTEVVFTSGATESNNIAILGLREYANTSGKKHFITTQIEHKAVLEPFQQLEKEGFEVTFLEVASNGLVSPNALKKALREDTCLVSIMHINNETGSIQDVDAFCQVLNGSPTFFHVDAAQSFGKYSESLTNKRIDLISASGHKVYAPMGIGALITRRRGFKRVPLKPLMFGGGQERGLRPGTLPVALIAGFGEAARLANLNSKSWKKHCEKLKQQALDQLSELNVILNGENSAPHVLNFSVPGLNSETALVALKGIAAVSNGSACTSNSYTPSHVLTAMGLDEEVVENAIRMSWCYMTDELPLRAMIDKLKQYL